MEIRKIIVADYDEGMRAESISREVRVSTSAIYRLLEKRQKAGTIEPSYEKSGRQSEVTAEKLAKMGALIAENSDITLAQIKETMHLFIQKSEKVRNQKSAISFATSWGSGIKKDGTCQ